MRGLLRLLRGTDSLQRQVGNDGEAEMGDLLPDQEEKNPADNAGHNMLRQRLGKLLQTLSWREREILKMRFGLGDGYSYTLEEVAHVFRVTRERIRQLEYRALRRLQDPRNSAELVGFLD